MQGFHHRGEFDPPEWANNLKNYYWFIRIEGRNQAKRRKYYRWVAKEKTALAEKGIDQDLIKIVCRYLISLSIQDGKKMQQLIENPSPQSSFDF